MLDLGQSNRFRITFFALLFFSHVIKGFRCEPAVVTGFIRNALLRPMAECRRGTQILITWRKHLISVPRITIFDSSQVGGMPWCTGRLHIKGTRLPVSANNFDYSGVSGRRSIWLGRNSRLSWEFICTCVPFSTHSMLSFD